LLPLGCEAAPSFRQTDPMPRIYGSCATEREQAPSPRGLWASYRSVVASPPFYSLVHLLALVSGEGFALMACTTLRDSAEADINTVTNIARIMVQDVADVFGVIEQRGLEGQ